MYCGKCGAEIAQDERFCGNCGTEVNSSFGAGLNGNNTTVATLPKDNSKNKTKLIMIISIATVLIIALGVFAYLFFTNQAKEQAFSSGLELGNKYLSELNYEDAISEFTKAIEIKPKESETYIKLAEVYTSQEDYDKALEILNNGLAQTQSEEIQAKITEVTTQKEEAEKVIQLTSYYTYKGQTYYGGGIYNDDWVKIPNLQGVASSVVVVDDTIYYVDQYNINEEATSSATIDFKHSLKKCNLDGSNSEILADDLGSCCGSFYCNKKLCYIGSSYHFGHYTTEVFIYNLETGENQTTDVPIHSSNDCKVSANGVICAFDSDSLYSTDNKLWFEEINLETNELKSYPYDVTGGFIDTDDEHIIYARLVNKNTSIYMADKDGNNEQLIINIMSDDVGDIKLYNDKIFWREGNSNIYCCDLNGNKTLIASDKLVAKHDEHDTTLNYELVNDDILYINKDGYIVAYNITSATSRNICKISDRMKSLISYYCNFYIEDDTLFLEVQFGGSSVFWDYSRVPTSGGEMDDYLQDYVWF